MKTILLSLTAAAALAAAVTPAAAQPAAYGHRPEVSQAYRHGSSQTVRIDRLDRRVADAAREHRMSWNQARDLRTDLRQVKSIAIRDDRGQISHRERQRLDRTIDRVEGALNRFARNDWRDDRRDHHGRR